MLASPKSQRRAALLLAVLLVVGINLLGDILASLFRPVQLPSPVAAKTEQTSQPSIPRGETPAQAPLPVTAPPPAAEKAPEAPKPAEPAKAEPKPVHLPPATVAERPSPKQAPSAGPGAPQVAMVPPPGAVSSSGALAERLRSADAVRGAKLSTRCSGCHGFDPGGRHRVGPNLYEVVGAQKGSKVGFAYSPAISGLGGVWSFQDLDAYLASPQNFAPGNKMAFQGLPDPSERADMLLFLRNLSANPKPLP
jgi:cytochrome c